jgi:hypothetical protein
MFWASEPSPAPLFFPEKKLAVLESPNFSTFKDLIESIPCENQFNHGIKYSRAGGRETRERIVDSNFKN